MLKKWQRMSMMVTLVVCMFTVLAFTQTAAAQSVVSHQVAKPTAFLDCNATAQRPVVYRRSLEAKGLLQCDRSSRLRVQITLYKIVGDDQVRVGSASQEDRDDSLRVSLDRSCQFGRYRSEVIGYAWDVIRQDWKRVAYARSEIVRASCFINRG
jgi:hypothetical protein